MNMRSIFTFAALSTFSAGIVGALGLSGCGEPQMYCLAPADGYASSITTLEGDNDCLPPHGVFGLDYYLGFNGEGNGPIANPDTAELAVTWVGMRDQINAAKEHIKVLKQYAECMGSEVDIETNFSEDFVNQQFYAKGKLNSASPQNDQCSTGNIGKGSLKIPAMPAIPECKKNGFEIEARPEFKAVDLSFESLSTTIEVTPAIQGLYANGQFNYSGVKADGTACSGKYQFEGINPVVDCESDEQCTKYQTGDKEQGIYPKILVQGQLKCAGLEKDGETVTSKGICILVPQS